MTPHKATPEQWAQLRACAAIYPGAWDDYILELHDRIAALEAAANSKSTPNPSQIRSSPAPAGGLVEMVADAMDGGTEAVILAVAEWLNKEAESHLGGGVYWSRRLREEVQRND
jgi:hypothetical protein